MPRITHLLVLLSLLSITGTTLLGQDADVAAKRDALHKAMVAPLNDPAQRQIIAQQVNLLNDTQVNRLFMGLIGRIQQLEEIQQRLLAREQVAWNLARQNQWLWMQMMQNRGWGNRAVGYRPIITWLPEGVNMTAGAVVSPDLRHVRISVNPFFSRIGPVDTFNYHTGQTRRIYTPSNPGSFSGSSRGGNAASTQPTRTVPEWYKRIRTNY